MIAQVWEIVIENRINMIEHYDENHTAYHEAGHIIASIEKGFEFESATITPHIDHQGNGSFAGRSMLLTPPDIYSAGNQAVIDLAGPSAEAKFRNCPVSICYDNSEHGDFTHSRKMVEMWFNLDSYLHLSEKAPQSKEDLFQQFEQEAEEIINKRWTWVTAIAKGLLERRTLSKSEIDEIIDHLEVN